MNAKKTLLALLIAAGPTLAMAANEIRFEGLVSASTCDVAVNGSATPVVLLPTVRTNQLLSANSKAGETSFNVAVTNCPATGLEVKTIFTGGIVDANGNLTNTGTAGAVALQIDHTAGGSGINLAGTWTSATGQGIQLASGATSGNKDYYVRYISVAGAATAGTVRGSLQYAVTYP